MLTVTVIGQAKRKEHEHMKKRTLICILLAVSLAVSLIVAGSPVRAVESVGNAGAAPDFTVLDGNGAAVRFTETAGKPAIINFWATWCPPCKAELPYFEEAYRQYGDRIRFMMIDLTDGFRDTEEGVKQFIGQNGYTFPIYYDTDFEAAAAYRISAIPLSVFINADGVIVADHVGAMNADILQSYIDMLMK